MPEMDLDRVKFVLRRITEINDSLTNLSEEGDLPTPVAVAVWGIDAQVGVAIRLLRIYVSQMEDAA